MTNESESSSEARFIKAFEHQNGFIPNLSDSKAMDHYQMWKYSEEYWSKRYEELRNKYSMKAVDLIAYHHERIELEKELTASRKRVEELSLALERLGSMEAFTMPRAVDKDLDEELIARIDFAREALDAVKEK